MVSNDLQRLRRGEGIVESLAFFAVGCTVMSFICAGSHSGAGSAGGVPGHDSYYHIKMATLLPELGLVKEFPWLKFVYFTAEGQGFVNHHYGFQLLLLPFVTAAQWLTGDAITGGRWAVATFFGVTLVMYNLVLRGCGVRWRWLWLFFFLLMPFQFFNRHAYVRAIGPSLICMLAVILAVMHQRWRLLGIVIAVYIHVYLGAVLYTPLLVGLYVVSCAIGPQEDRAIPWKMLLWSAAGWSIGVVTHPYAGGILDFLRLQVFGSGLTPDISVGREWKSYEGVWWFAQMSGNVFLLWMLGLCVRLRIGPRLTAWEFFLLLLSFAFLFLTAKARRFIEYWPVFCLLSAAALLAPLAGSLAGWVDRLWNPPRTSKENLLRWVALVFLVVALVLLVPMISGKTSVTGFTNKWLTWSMVLGVCVLGPMMRIWLSASRRQEGGAMTTGQRCIISTGILSVGLALFLATACFASGGILEARRTARRPFDLAAVKDAMNFLQETSNPGDVVFTDDWDIFPVLFCYNSKNHYVVGLDPKFPQALRPELWERYVKISRGQVPADVSVSTTDASGQPATDEVHVALQDIRDHFGARFVVTDRDHTPLAKKLADARGFAELIYPSTSYESVRDAPFLIFRIRDIEHEPE